MVQLLAKIGNIVLRVIAGTIASTMLAYSGYAVYDSYYTNKQAFASWDLEQYKPVQVEADEGNNFEDILQVNENVVGWISVPDTNIDYPIVQGSDDIEYASKDIYGNPSITGSIYLAFQNARDFSNLYNVIYGHHMDNGAMFGDIDKFTGQAFFDGHNTAYLMTPDKTYALHIFAFVQTDAYDSNVYSILKNNRMSADEILTYIRDNALYYREAENTGKIVALSTCSSFAANGRAVLFTMAQEVKDIPDEAPPKALNIHKAVGHGKTQTWALLNLICVALTFYAWLPLFQLKRKFGRRKKAKLWIEEAQNRLDANTSAEEAEQSNIKKLIDDLKKFLKAFRIGCIAEPVIAGAALIVFIITENLRTPMTLIDKYTPIMLAIFGVAIITDRILFFYRGEQWEEDDTANDSKNSH